MLSFCSCCCWRDGRRQELQGRPPEQRRRGLGQSGRLGTSAAPLTGTGACRAVDKHARVRSVMYMMSLFASRSTRRMQLPSPAAACSSGVRATYSGGGLVPEPLAPSAAAAAAALRPRVLEPVVVVVLAVMVVVVITVPFAVMVLPRVTAATCAAAPAASLPLASASAAAPGALAARADFVPLALAEP